MRGFVMWLQATPLAHGIAKSNHLLIASLQILHVFGFIFLLAPLILLALRILGLILKDQAPAILVGPCRTVSSIGLAMSLGSGVFMFLSAPLHYYGNWAFDAKMGLLVAALALSAALFGWLAYRTPRASLPVKLGISLSIMLWIAVCMAGRAIGFV